MSDVYYIPQFVITLFIILSIRSDINDIKKLSINSNDKFPMIGGAMFAGIFLFSMLIWAGFYH